MLKFFDHSFLKIDRFTYIESVYIDTSFNEFFTYLPVQDRNELFIYLFTCHM